MNDTWKKIRDELTLELGESAGKLLQKTTAYTQGDVVEISCADEGVRFLIESKYKKHILTKYMKHTEGLVSTVRTTSKPTPLPTSIGPLFPTQDTLATRLRQSHIHSSLNFDTFAVSVSNQIAHAAAQAVAKQPGEVYNPLFLWGGVGVGKTHLMHAIGERILRETDMRVYYCSAEEFTNSLVESIRTKSSGVFRRRFRSVDVLLIDDIQFVSQREFVQEELFNTFNTLHTQKKQIVFTADKPPRALERIEQRLSSRFMSGLVVDIGRPDFELKTAIILIKARQRDLYIDMDGAKIIAASVEDIREIEGFLLKLQAVFGARVSIEPEEIRKRLLLPTDTPQHALSPKEIIRIVSQETGIPVKEIRGESRRKTTALSRHIAMYLLKTHTALTYEEIAILLGRKDHTTVMHGVQKVVSEMGHNDNTRKTVEKIRLYFS